MALTYEQTVAIEELKQDHKVKLLILTEKGAAQEQLWAMTRLEKQLEIAKAMPTHVIKVPSGCVTSE